MSCEHYEPPTAGATKKPHFRLWLPLPFSQHSVAVPVSARGLSQTNRIARSECAEHVRKREIVLGRRGWGRGGGGWTKQHTPRRFFVRCLLPWI